MSAGPFVPITLDLTHVCQLRCDGCYFFSEQLDDSKAPRDEAVFLEFVERERARGTNFVTVIGGEPSLQLDRLRILHENFRCTTVTNGLRIMSVAQEWQTVVTGGIVILAVYLDIVRRRRQT